MNEETTGLSRLVTDREVAHEEAIEWNEIISSVKEKAGRDHLTGLILRGPFEAAMRRETVRGERTQEPVTLLMLDIDNFKSYNDAFGHNGGDIVLKSLAVLMKEVVRKSDVVARWGGEEFVMMYPNTDLEQAEVVAERFRGDVEKRLS